MSSYKLDQYRQTFIIVIKHNTEFIDKLLRIYRYGCSGDNAFFFYVSELSYAWTFNDSPLYVQEDKRRFVSQDTGNLYFAKVEPSDVGNYTCFVTNKEAHRSVQGPPTPLVLRTDGKNINYLQTPPGLLHCGQVFGAFFFFFLTVTKITVV